MALRKFFVLAGVLLLAAACGSTPTTPSATQPAYSQTDLRLGSGDTAAASGNSITVNYTGWLYDSSKADFKGLQFDTSNTTGPFTFTLGQAQVIAGWDQGIVGMKPGGLRQLIIPPTLAYGSTRFGSIPPNSTLVFEVELVSIN